jgi:hypothetical protein
LEGNNAGKWKSEEDKIQIAATEANIRIILIYYLIIQKT